MRNKVAAGAGLIVVLFLILKFGKESEFDSSSSEGNESGDFSRVKELRLSDREGVTSAARSTRKLVTPQLSRDFKSWQLSRADLELIEELNKRLMEREVSRIVKESHSYASVDVVPEMRELLGIPSAIDVVEFLKVQTVVRPPNNDELISLKTEVGTVIESIDVEQQRGEQMRSFFGEKFSFGDDRFKILTTDAYTIGDKDEVKRTTTAQLGKEVAEMEVDQKTVFYFEREFEVEDTAANPDKFVSDRYDHLVDTRAGE